jgi:hypothetical protein
MNQNHKTIESLLTKTAQEIAVPSRDAVSAIVTKGAQARYTYQRNQQSFRFLDAIQWFRSPRIRFTSIIASLAVGLAVIVIAVVPQFSSDTVDPYTILHNENQVELARIDGEDQLADLVIEEYVAQFLSLEVAYY